MCTIFSAWLSRLVLPGPPSIENGAHGTEKFLLKTKW
jgi:hypothetical protein